MESDIIEKNSTFVTVIAWIGIVISGFSTLMALLQSIMFTFIMNEGFDEALNASQAEQNENMPPIFAFMANNFEYLFYLFFLISFFSFIASVGLLKRKNWARISIIGLLVLSIAWNFGGFGVQYTMMSDFGSLHGTSMTLMTKEEMEDKAKRNYEKVLARYEDKECCEKTDPCCKKPLTYEEQLKKLEENQAQQIKIQGEMKGMFKGMMIFGIFMILIMSAIEGWIVWKLTRPQIVREFKPDIIS